MILPSSWEDKFEPVHVFQIKPSCETNTIPPPPPRTTAAFKHMAVDLMGSAGQGTTLSPGSARKIPSGPLQAHPTVVTPPVPRQLDF